MGPHWYTGELIECMSDKEQSPGKIYGSFFLLESGKPHGIFQVNNLKCDHRWDVPVNKKNFLIIHTEFKRAENHLAYLLRWLYLMCY